LYAMTSHGECTPMCAWLVDVLVMKRIDGQLHFRGGSATFLTVSPDVYPDREVVNNTLAAEKAMAIGVPQRIDVGRMCRGNAKQWVPSVPGICHLCYEHKATRGVCPVVEHLTLCPHCGSTQ
jgi:hypothetical protein